MASAGSNHAYSGRYNRRLVFDLVRTKGQLSRGDLVTLTGLQPQTISNITRELLDRNLLAEASRAIGGRGAPQKYLRVEGSSGCSIGLHIDRDILTGVACDLLAGEITRCQTTIPWQDPEASIASMANVIGSLTAECADIPVWGVGVSMPTLQEAEFEEYVGSPGWQEWSRIDVADAIEAACGLPVIVENDATAAAIAELHTGAAAGLHHCVYIFIGHGLGAGIIIDGLPFQGAANNAGEIGLLSWPDELQGQTAGNATPFSIDELADMVGCDVKKIETGDTLEMLYRDRNSALMSWLDLNARRLRMLVAIIENMFDPETVLVGGRLAPPVMASLVDRAYPLLPSAAARRNRDRPRLQVAQLGADASAIGAAMLPVIAHGSPSFRRLSLMRGRRGIIDPETRFDRVAG